MTRILATVAMACAVVVMLSGCAMPSGIMGGTMGMVYTQTQGPVTVGDANGSEKVGTSMSTGIICIATGDASIAAAMQNGGIKKIHHVDYKVTSILGVYCTYTTVVYGE